MVVLLLLAGCDEFGDIAEAEPPDASPPVAAAPPSHQKGDPEPPVAAPVARPGTHADPDTRVPAPPRRPERYVDEYVDTPTAAAPVPDSEELPSPAGPGRPPGARIYPQNVSDRPIPRIGEQPWMISEEWLRQHERQLKAPNRSKAQVVFIGDSIVAAWRVAPAYREVFGKYSPLNLGISGDHTQNVLYRVKNGALAELSPKAVVLMVGVNNLAGGFTVEQTVSGVHAVVDAIRSALPNTPVLLLAVLPARANPDDPLRQKITDTNRQLQGFAKAGQVVFHDAGSVLLEPDGTIEKSILRDFVHPTATGYERLSQSLAPVLANLVGK